MLQDFIISMMKVTFGLRNCHLRNTYLKKQYLKNRKMAKHSQGLALAKTLISHFRFFLFFFHFYLKTLDILQT